MIIVGIDYEEYKPETYKGVFLNEADGTTYRWMTDDSVKDYAAAMEFARGKGWDAIMHFSSVDHFVMDGGILEVK
jgi:hypothetical protein